MSAHTLGIRSHVRYQSLSSQKPLKLSTLRSILRFLKQKLRKPLKVATHSTRSLPPGPAQGCHPSERSDAGMSLLLRSRGARQLCLSFSHGFTPEVDLVGVVNQPIQNRIRQSGVTDDVMSFLDRELAGGDGGTTAIPVFQHFQQVSSVLCAQFHESPIVQDQYIDFGEIC